MAGTDRSRPSLLVVGAVTVVVVVGGMVAWFLFELIVLGRPRPDHALIAANHQVAQAEAQRMTRLRVGGAPGRVIRDFDTCGYDIGVTSQTPFMSLRWDPAPSRGALALDDLVKALKSIGYSYDLSDAEPVVTRDGVRTVDLQRRSGHKVIYLSATQAERNVKLQRAEYPSDVADPFPALTISLNVSPSGCDTRFPDP